MDKAIVIELIKAASAIIVALLGKVSWDAIGSIVRRWRYNIPEIMDTKWGAEWRFDDGSMYVSDKVTFKKWTKKSQFEGFGEATYDNKEYKYPIEGEVSPRGIVVLKYKAEKYPTEAN